MCAAGRQPRNCASYARPLAYAGAHLLRGPGGRQARAGQATAAGLAFRKRVGKGIGSPDDKLIKRHFRSSTVAGVGGWWG